MRKILLLGVFLCVSLFGRTEGGFKNDKDFEKGEKAYKEKRLFSAAKYFQKSCDNGNKAGCEMASKSYFAQGERYRKRDESIAKGAYEKACKMGHADGCYRIGKIRAKDPAKCADAAKELEFACKKGNEKACVELKSVASKCKALVGERLRDGGFRDGEFNERFERGKFKEESKFKEEKNERKMRGIRERYDD